MVSYLNALAKIRLFAYQVHKNLRRLSFGTTMVAEQLLLVNNKLQL